MLIQTTKLTRAQKLDVELLEQICKEKEELSSGMLLDSSFNVISDIPCFFLLYEDTTKELIAALSIFLPSYREAEISAYTHPAYRKKGYFSYLLNRAYQVISKYSTIVDITVITEPNGKAAVRVAERRGFKLLYSDYLMGWQGDVRAFSENASLNHLRVSKHYSAMLIKKLSHIHSEAFVYPLCISEKILFEWNQDDSIEIGIYEIRDTIVGMCCAQQIKDGWMLIGICISLNEQKKGYGTDMLQEFLFHLGSRNQNSPFFYLHVESKAKGAYHIYQKIGFQVIEQIDHWKIEENMVI